MESEKQTYTLSVSMLLQLSEKHLRLRNFSLSSQYAIETLQSTAQADATHQGIKALRDRAHQIVAISDVLYAAARTLGTPHPNWYSVLGLDNFSSDQDQLKFKFKKLLVLLYPVKSTCPWAQEALLSIWKAWNVLAYPDKKSAFDAQFRGEIVKRSHPEEKSESFWTVCPYCYFMYEYPRYLEGCCLRCQNDLCRKVYQGISSSSPPPVKSNQDVSFGCMGFFPLGFSQSEGGADGKQFAPWSPFVGMYGLQDKGSTSKSKGFEDYTATVGVSEALLHNGHGVPGLGSHAGTRPKSIVMESYTVTPSGKMLMQKGTPLQMNKTVDLNEAVEKGTPLQMNKTADLNDAVEKETPLQMKTADLNYAVENRDVAMEANCDQFEGEDGLAPQEYDPEADVQFVEKDGEIFVEVSSDDED